jgi:DNA-binding IclR family transcriptional regulator
LRIDAYSFAMGNTARRGDAVGVQSVDRAITVLEVLARRGEARVSEVAAEIDVHKSTAFRLLGALEGRGLVEQAGDRGKYRLGVGLIPLAGAVSDRLDVTRQGRHVCERLAAELGETVNMAVLQEQWAVNVDQARGPSTVSTHNWVGKLTPLHCTASGKVLLAHVDRHVHAALRRFTPRTVTNPTALEAELAEVRTTGVARAYEEYEVGLNALAAPVRDRFGVVVAAVSVSGPSYRLTPERMDEVVPTLVAGAAEISRRMGYFSAT